MALPPKDKLLEVMNKISMARCPECGGRVFFSRIFNREVTLDPDVVCDATWHWKGKLSECEGVGDERS